MIEPTALDEEVDRYRRLLRGSIRAAGLTVAEVERRLGARPRTLQRMLAGRFDLKLRHILMVLTVLGVEQEEFFSAAAGRRQASAGGVLGLLDGMGYRGRPQELDEPKASPEEFQRMVDEAVEQTLERFAREGRPVRPEAESTPDPVPRAGTPAPERKVDVPPSEASPRRTARGRKPKL